MDKDTIVTRVATSTQTTKSQTALVITRCLEIIMQAVQRGDTVKLRGFGRFDCRHRQARLGRNPRTGAVIPIAARAKPTFTASQLLHAAVQSATRGHAGPEQPPG
jgi:nucleoid DNA-binding protein